MESNHVYSKELIDFCKTILNLKLEPYQEVLMMRMFDDKYKVKYSLYGQIGYKKLLQYRACLEKCLNGESAIILNPTKERANQTLEELCRILFMGNIGIKYKFEDYKIVFDNGGLLEIQW